MTDWTSLSVTEEQKRQIEAAQEDAGHDGAIGRFIVQQVSGETKRKQTIDVEDARLLAQHVERSLEPYFCDIVDVNDASDIRDAGQQQMDKLTTIESAAKEATQAAQSAEQSVEELQR